MDIDRPFYSAKLRQLGQGVRARAFDGARNGHGPRFVAGPRLAFADKRPLAFGDKLLSRGKRYAYSHMAFKLNRRCGRDIEGIRYPA
jgi:hypothetical protein